MPTYKGPGNDFTTALKLLKEHAYEAVAIQ